MPVTRALSRREMQYFLSFVVNEWILIIKDITEIVRSNAPANRANLHSLTVACRTNVELVKFAIENIQSTGVETLNRK